MRHLKYKKKTHDNLFDNNKNFYWNIKNKKTIPNIEKNYYFFLIFILTKTKKNKNYFLN